MKTANSKASPLSFKDVYGATVSIPSGEVADYAGIRVEQLHGLTAILASGKHTGLAESSVQLLAVMANELANHVSCLIELVAEDVRTVTKGGAR